MPASRNINWTWKHSYAVFLLFLLVIAGLEYRGNFESSLSPGVRASVIWGGLTLLLCLIFMLGAAGTPGQFLVFFGSGAFGAGMGYLVGAWLTPGGESNPLDQVRNIVAGVLTGVVGTKLLTLWDDLVDKPEGGGKPPILTPSYFIPIILFLVGFSVSLSAFYTVRTSESGDVRVTYYPPGDVRVLGPKRLGILPDTLVQFSGAANSPVDVRVDWSFRLEEPCGSPSQNSVFNKAQFDKEMIGAFDPATGKLKTPPLSALQGWINSCPGSQNWRLTAISVQDRSRSSEYHIRFCRTKEDCPFAAAGNSPNAGKASSEIPKTSSEDSGETSTQTKEQGKAAPGKTSSPR